MSWLAMYAVALLLWAAVSLTPRRRQPTKELPPIAKVQRHGLQRPSQANKVRPHPVQIPQAMRRLNKPQMPRWGVTP